MSEPQRGEAERRRLASLAAYGVLDTPPEAAFDDLTLLAAQICGRPMAMISFVDGNRQWFKSKRGVDFFETPRDVSFCTYAIEGPAEVMVVEDAWVDERFGASPLVVDGPRIRFYAGAPLVARDGAVLGTLCVADSQPGQLAAAQIEALKALSRAAVSQLELRSNSRKLAAELAAQGEREAEMQRQTEQLRIVRDEAARSLVIAEKSRQALLSVLEDEKRAGHQLRASEERFRHLIENSTDVIVVIDERGVVGFQSPSTRRALGYSPEEMAGRNVLEIIHPEDRNQATRSISEAMARVEGRLPVEYRVLHKDGGWRIFQSIGKSMTDSSGKIGIVVNARDVTESRQLEEKFLRAQRLEAVGTLASGVAHDLNNILTPVLMVAGLLKETLVSAHDRDLLTMVERSAQRGAAIISQLLTFSRGIEGARISIQPRHLLKEAAHLMAETFPRGIQLVNEISDDLWNIVVDTTQFHQVLLNLCVNARDAMPHGGQLTLAARNVLLGANDVKPHAGVSAGMHVMVTVTDTGHGIPPEVIERIFDPFFTTKEVGKGTGLGLSTVLGIVKSHRGFVDVESVPGRGTSFRVYFPAVEMPVNLEIPESPPAAAMGRDEMLLVVDDEPQIREAMKEILELHHYRVLTAGNGQEAIRVFIEHGERVQLVITDVMMPLMGGTALINTLRVLKPGIKAIATTGLEHEAKAAEFHELGVRRLLAKPFTPLALLTAVAENLPGRGDG